MAFIEYVLLALIASSGAAGLPAATPGTTLGPEAIVQPNGGVFPAVVHQDKKDDTKKIKPLVQHRRHTKTRHAAKTPKKRGTKT